MAMSPAILHAHVYHKRFFSRTNAFRYKIYYLSIPVDQTQDTHRYHGLSINQPDWLSFHAKDHGHDSSQSLTDFIHQILEQQGLLDQVHSTQLIAMPRVLGYGFNPVSFWLCKNAAGQLIAVLAEVHNTFGEKHSYLCCHQDHAIIRDNDYFYSSKCFHVSPFLPRDGHYRFNFLITDQLFSVKIDYYNADNQHQLTTALTGKFKPLNRAALIKAFWSYPLVTLKSMTMIHYQALRLWFKRIPFFPLPQQYQNQLTLTKRSDQAE